MSATAAQLAARIHMLATRWRETERFWQGAKREEFERQYLAGLIQDADAAVKAMEQIDHLLAQARSDCE